MATRLKNLRLDRIDLVDRGASQDEHGEGAHVILFKRAEQVAKQPTEAAPNSNSNSNNGEQARTFNEMLAERMDSEVYTDAKDELWDYVYALQNALCSALKDAAVTDKAAAMRNDVMQFQAALQEAIPIWSGGGAVYKVGRKVSAGRMARLRTMYEHLKAIMTEGGEDMVKMDVNKLAPEVQAHIVEIEKAAKDEQERLAKRVAELEAEVKKLAPGPTQEDLMKNVPDAIKKQMEDQAKEIKDTKEKLAKSEDERLAKQYETEVAGSFGALALDPAKDGPVLKAVDQKLTKEEAARVREILTSTNALLEKSDLFVELGAGGAGGSASGTAWAQIQKLAKDKVDKKECATIEQAIDAVAKEHPELYAQHEDEQAG